MMSHAASNAHHRHKTLVTACDDQKIFKGSSVSKWSATILPPYEKRERSRNMVADHFKTVTSCDMGSNIDVASTAVVHGVGVVGGR